MTQTRPVRALHEGLLLKCGRRDTPFVLGSPGYEDRKVRLHKAPVIPAGEPTPSETAQRKRQGEGEQAPGTAEPLGPYSLSTDSLDSLDSLVRRSNLLVP